MLNRIAVYIPKLLHALAFGINIEVVVAGLPEWPLFATHSDGQLQGLESFGKNGIPWLAEQQVDMLGHDNISGHPKVVSHTHCLKRSFEEVPRFRSAQVRLAAMATEGHKMKLAGMLISNQTLGHAIILFPGLRIETWGTRTRLDYQCGCPTISTLRPESPRKRGG